MRKNLRHINLQYIYVCIPPLPNSAALRQGPHFKVTAVASRWQRVGDLIGSGFELHTCRSRRLTTCAIWWCYKSHLQPNANFFVYKFGCMHSFSADAVLLKLQITYFQILKLTKARSNYPFNFFLFVTRNFICIL